MDRKMNPVTSRSRRPSSLTCAAATEGVLRAAPRPRLPALASPPRSASSSSIMPPSGWLSSRSRIACISLCLTIQVVLKLTLQVHRRKAILRLREQVHRQIPHAQRRIGVLTQGACGRRGLMFAANTLEDLAGM